ncbi:MAG: DUF2092 domain-containing protein [Chitinophagales bacterium]|nr:DUF2092 domain-containing protein [Saprospiraceae bacterium]
MKKLLLSSIWVLFAFGTYAQATNYDPVAVLILDRMSDVIGDLNSCSYKTNASHDEFVPEYGMIKQFVNSEVHMVGPNKMVVNFWGPRGHRQCWYNGDQFAYYDYEENNYGLIEAPGTIIATIDSIHQYYNVDFPAGDFFYPAFTDDLIESSDKVVYLGTTNINGKECFHIAAMSKVSNTQIWISNDAYTLPVKYVIDYYTVADSPQYETTFSDWQINPDIPGVMFDFLPPPGAKQVRMMSTTEK